MNSRSVGVEEEFLLVEPEASRPAFLLAGGLAAR
jgi:hypothetical protein